MVGKGSEGSSALRIRHSRRSNEKAAYEVIYQSIVMLFVNRIYDGWLFMARISKLSNPRRLIIYTIKSTYQSTRMASLFRFAPMQLLLGGLGGATDYSESPLPLTQLRKS